MRIIINRTGESMKKRYVQTLITVLVMSSLVVMPVMAEPNDEVQALEIQKSELEDQAGDIQSQLVSLLVNFNALQQDIENQSQRIVQAETDLQEAEAKEKAQYEDMKLRIQYIYEESDDSLLEALITSRSFSELVNKAEYIQNVHSYDRKQLQEYIDTKQEVENLKVELEAGQADMEAMAADLSTQQAGLETTLADMRSRIADFDSQLESAKAQAAAEVQQLTQATENVVAAAEQGGGNASVSKPASQPSNPTGGTSTSTGNSNSSVSSSNNTNTSKPSGGTSGSTGSGSTTTSKPSNAALGQQIANKACQYIGNKYVYGGNSLTNGIDCSGFVKEIHALFGISTPRTTDSIQVAGKAVSYSEMLPGDVICYSQHVAIYIGNNTVVHASNSNPYPVGGIKTTSPANYRTVLAVRRFW